MNLILALGFLSGIVFAQDTIDGMEPSRKIDLPPIETAVDNVRYDVIKYVKYIWRGFNRTTYRASDLNVIGLFENLFHKIEKAERTTKPGDLDMFTRTWPYSFLHAEVAKLNTLYEDFKKFFSLYVKFVEKTKISWIAFANLLRDPNTGISGSLHIIRKYLSVEKETENVYMLIQKQTKYDICNIKQSPYQTLYNFHNVMAVIELKTFAMMQIGFMILTVFNEGNFKEDARTAMEAYEYATRKQISKIKNILSKADRSFYLCDPKEFTNWVTYVKLTKLLMGYIENERNMHDHGLCIRTCSMYSSAKYITCYTKRNEFCRYQPKCRGRIHNCRLITPDMTVCVSKDSSRRYDWVDYDGGPILGKKSYCSAANTYRVTSWTRVITECHYCLCLCDEGIVVSDRFFNLRDVTSDVAENKVVTGLRIIKTQRIIHLQIQQGVLIPRGLIDPKTISWKPVESYSIQLSNMTNGIDYQILTKRERSINLNDFVAPSEHVITGVRFRKTGEFISLGVRITPINFETGSVSSELQSKWLTNWKYPAGEIKLNEPDVPTRSGPHHLVKWPNAYVEFQPTDFSKDLAQSTVPYLDSQETSLDLPLSGVGLIYRGKKGSGGFIAPKLITYEYGNHLTFD